MSKNSEDKTKSFVQASMSYIRKMPEKREESMKKTSKEKYTKLSNLKDRKNSRKYFKNSFERYLQNKEEIRCTVRRKSSKLKSMGSNM